MARADRVSSRRTLAAFVLTAVAISLPTAAWFVAGMRDLDRKTHLQEKSVYQGAKSKAVVLAERLATRFEVLRQAESRRPFVHYQNLYHDPRGAAHGPAITVSPLAEGVADPLVEVHFQVDAEGKLSLPTVNDDFPELGNAADQGHVCGLMADLAEVAIFCPLGETQEDWLFELDTEFAVAELSPLEEIDPATTVRREVLSLGSWRQHLQANSLYADLKAGREPTLAPADTPTDRRTEGRSKKKKVEVLTAPFSWHTLPIGNGVRPMALRSVETPAGPWTQGFAIDRGTVDQYLASAPYPARFISRDEASVGDEVRVPIGGTPWAIAFDVSAELGTSFGKIAAERERFLGFFLLGALAAALAGLMVVAMVYQSEQLAQQRAQFAASAAHELRTPLAGLRLYGEMLAEGMGDPSRAQRYARRMAGEAERLGRVVTNVLSFTRLERKSLALHPEPGDLGLAVVEAVERQRTALEENGAVLETEIGEGLPQVAFDRDALVNVVQNLLDNAEKYTRGIDGRTIRVELSARRDHLILRVSDNGRGVAPELRRRLFKPFSRGQHEDASEGLGLGLVLVRAVVRAQGGSIRYDDAPGGGAQFTVKFPKLAGEAQAAAAAVVPS